ncbi:MAG TPA: heparinase II/III family protein [Beijerinckiaceae bacterium]|nr:heparinase II/III family protein [Beijerinckiaceae bacterium]
MTGSTVAERVRLASLIGRKSIEHIRRGMGSPLRLAAMVRVASPERLLIAPQDIRTADPTVADDIYAGYFAFAGKVIDAHGRSPCEIEGAAVGWQAALSSFGWLRHLRAAGTALARANARVLVDDWMSLKGRPSQDVAWQVDVAARRLLSWLSQSPLILEGADRAFYRRFMKSLGRHAAFLTAALGDGLAGETQLIAVVALAELGLCAEGMAKLQRRATRLLADELSRQILPDGGHISRNPQKLLDLLLDLLPLRQAFAARAVAPPQILLNAIDRMLPMLRLFRHGDGSLALFNGMGVTAPDTLATILAYDDSRAVALANAPYTGYQRGAAGASVFVIDSGTPPAPAFSTEAHAGTLSFEFSIENQRIIVNCGACGQPRTAMRRAGRVTAAHSTLVVSDVSSSRFAAKEGIERWLEDQIVARPEKVLVARGEDAGAVTIEASHDGYEHRFGLIHVRRLRLSADGYCLDGEDRLKTSGRRVPGAVSADYALRFHLHPAVRFEPGGDDAGVVLALPDGQRWHFAAGGQAIEIEESIFFAGPDSPRPTQQMVVHAKIRDISAIGWRLERIG